MKKKLLCSLLLGIIMFIPWGNNCFAEDYSLYTQEQLQAEISRLEEELDELYKLLESKTESESETEPKSDDYDLNKEQTYTGNGDDVVTLAGFDDFYMFQIDGNNEGGYFGVVPYDASGNRMSSLVNTTDPYHGRVYDPDQSSSMLEVTASGEWTIKILSVYNARYGVKGDTVTGSGDDVIIFYTDNGSSLTASITGNSDGNYFGIIPYNGQGRRLSSLVNTTDPYSGKVMLKDEPRIFQILATGDWSITFE